MTDDAQLSLRDLLSRLEIVLSQSVDFAKTDTATTLAKVRLLTAAATYFNISWLSRTLAGDPALSALGASSTR